MITNKFYKKEKLLENEKDLAKQKLSSKPAKAAETTETVEAAVQKSLTQNRQNIPRSSQQNDKSKTAKASPSRKTMLDCWCQSDVSDSQLNNSNDSNETQIV